MNHNKARQLCDENGNPNGAYRYTCRNDDNIYPVGYCAGWDDRYLDWAVTEDEKQKLLAHKDKYHEGPHLSEKAACDCYKEWLLDHARYDTEHSETNLGRCAICKAVCGTKGYIPVAMIYRYLCDEHRNRKGLSDAMGTVGESFSS